MKIHFRFTSCRKQERETPDTIELGSVISLFSLYPSAWSSNDSDQAVDRSRGKKSSTMGFPDLSGPPAPVPHCLSHAFYINKEKWSLSTVLTELYYFSSPLVYGREITTLKWLILRLHLSILSKKKQMLKIQQ